MNYELPQVDLLRMLPEIFLFLWALVVMTFDLFTKRRSGSSVATLAMAGIAITGAIMATMACWGSEGWSYFGSGFGLMFINDSGSLFFKIIFLGAAFMAVSSSFGIMANKIRHHRGEYFGISFSAPSG